MISFRHLGRQGRTGNALYQLAATAGIADTLGTEPRFNADWTHRDAFAVPDAVFTEHFSGCIDATDTALVGHIDVRARPYLQDLALFEPILPTIREWLAPSERSLRLMADDPQVAAFEALPRPILSVHVRRGDKVPGQDPGTPDNDRYFRLPSLDYYLRAIEAAGPYASVAVFGDDPVWNAAHIPADHHHVGVPRPKEQDPDFDSAPVLDMIDLFLQARCDGHVLSGSTFGIWGALLADDEHAIYPFPTYGPALRYIDEGLLYPKSWVRLDSQTGLPC